MGEPIRDVKRIELLVSQIQKSQDVGVVLIASANTAKKILLMIFIFIFITVLPLRDS